MQDRLVLSLGISSYNTVAHCYRLDDKAISGFVLIQSVVLILSGPRYSSKAGILGLQFETLTRLQTKIHVCDLAFKLQSKFLNATYHPYMVFSKLLV